MIPKPLKYIGMECEVWGITKENLAMFSSVQFSHSAVSNSLQPHGLRHARLSCPSPTPGAYLVGDAIQPSRPLSSPILLPSIFPSIRVFSSESVLHIRWPKYWSFSFSISPSSEYSGLISFRMDWLDLSAVQRTLKSLLQHHSSKASILLCSVGHVSLRQIKILNRIIVKGEKGDISKNFTTKENETNTAV